jgi:hypothetical protein
MARFDHEVAHKVAHEIQRMRQIRALRQARRQAAGKDQWIQWKSIDWRSAGFAPRPAETLPFETRPADQAGST